MRFFIGVVRLVSDVYGCEGILSLFESIVDISCLTIRNFNEQKILGCTIVTMQSLSENNFRVLKWHHSIADAYNHVETNVSEKL